VVGLPLLHPFWINKPILFLQRTKLFSLQCSVADLHHFDADPDADPDPGCHFDADAGPDPTFHFDADPDPDPSFQIKVQNLTQSAQIGRYIFHTFWPVICKFRQIQIQFINLMRIRILPFNLMWIRIRITTLLSTDTFIPGFSLYKK
jgi:hypothetical protein